MRSFFVAVTASLVFVGFMNCGKSPNETRAANQAATNATPAPTPTGPLATPGPTPPPVFCFQVPTCASQCAAAYPHTTTLAIERYWFARGGCGGACVVEIQRNDEAVANYNACLNSN